MISIKIPVSWKIPEMLDLTSPEENKIILESGCHILTTSRNEAAGLNNNDQKIRLNNLFISKVIYSLYFFNHLL